MSTFKNGSKHTQNSIVVIGGGPAGIMAAIAAAKNIPRKEVAVMLLEKNQELGKKLKITGGSRCNITNAGQPRDILENIVTNKKFATKSIYTFSSQDLMQMLEANGCPLKAERNNEIYPRSDDSTQVVETLLHILNAHYVKLYFRTEVEELFVNNSKITGIRLKNGQTYGAAKVVLATGGISYPVTGSTGKGFELAKKLGHSVTPLKPSLAPLVIKEKWITELAGIAFNDIIIKTKIEKTPGKLITKKFDGDLLITHFGISGPAPLHLSTLLKDIYIPAEGHRISIDFVPELSHKWLQEEFISKSTHKKQISTILADFWPKRFVSKILAHLDVKESTRMNQLSKKERNTIINSLKDLKLTVLKVKNTNEAMVTSGGINTNEISPSTLESKFIQGLHFAGEILDVDALSGGFNLQLAFSTGFLAGKSSACSLELY